MDDVPATAISTDDMLPAIAQGAIGIERRSNDSRAAEMLEAIHHAETGLRLSAERSLLAGTGRVVRNTDCRVGRD